MPKTHHKYFHIILIIVLSFIVSTTKGQDNNLAPIPLIPYLQKLEKKFDVKFSFVDEDIEHTQFLIPKSAILKVILDSIADQTKLKIKQIDNRYYSIFKTTNISICGQILDNFKNPIDGATIEVLESTVALESNAIGNFSSVNIPNKAVLRIRHLGFKTKYITAENLAHKNICSFILLNPHYQKLDEIVMVQLLTTGLTKQKDASIQLNTNDFGILPGLIEPDVLQTVQALPGIKSIDETVSNINIRGGTNDQNLILWDDIKMYQSGHFFGLISSFNPYLTTKISLIRNGTSAKYGDGVSGIVRMETNDKIQKLPYGGAGINLISSDFYGQLPITKKLALQFSARRSITDFFYTPIYKQFFNRVFQNSDIDRNNINDTKILRDETFYFYDFTTKILYDINSKHKLRISLINSVNALDYKESTENTNNNTNSTLNQTNIALGSSIKSNWSPKFSSFINAYYTHYNLDSENILPNESQKLNQKNEVLETAIQLHTNYTFSNTVNWLNGYSFSEIGINNTTNVMSPAFKSNIKGVVRTHALFSELAHTSKNKKTNAKIGMRINSIENINGTFEDYIIEPRVNLNYTFAKNLYIELLGEYKNQVTNQVLDLKQNFLGVEKRRWILSNGKSLPVIKSKQLSIGLNYTKKDLYIGLEGFYKKVNGISTASQGFQNQNQFNGQIGSYATNGIEFLINKKTNTFSTWFSYAYNINNYTFNTISPSTFSNNLDIRHTASIAGTYNYKNLKLGLSITYKSGSPYTQPLKGDTINYRNFPNTINYEKPNSSRLPDYVRADASAVYNFTLASKIKASVGVSVLNLLGRKNILNTFYRLNDANKIETTESVSLGITPNVNFRVSF